MQPTVLDKQGRAFIPTGRELSRQVLAATKLTEPGQRETLKLMAPAKTAITNTSAPFRTLENMFGTLMVVKDKAALLQASAEPPPNSAWTRRGIIISGPQNA